MRSARSLLVLLAGLLLAAAAFAPATAQSAPAVVLRVEGTEATGCNPTGAQLACFNPTEGDPATAFVAGKTVQVELTAAGEAPHSINVIMNDDASPVHLLTGTAFGTALAQSAEVAPGESAILEFTVPESGTLYFYCAVPDHEPIGMWFTAEIQPAGSGGSNETGNETGNGTGTGNETGGNTTAPPAPATGGSGGNATDDGAMDGGNATGDAGNDTMPSDEEESPGLGLVGLIGTVALVGLVLRRRR